MKNNKDQYRKIFAKISAKMPKGSFGLAGLGEKSSSKISYDLAQTMAKVKKVLLIDLDNQGQKDPDFANINQLLRGEGEFLQDGKLYRLNFTQSDDVEMLIESKNFVDLILKAKDDFDYILINEKPLKSSQAYFTSAFEDGKVLLVREEETDKNDFNLKRAELNDLGFNILGVIYHK